MEVDFTTAESPVDVWTIAAYGLSGIALLACNFYFVVSEFAIVKIRDSQVAALELGNDPRVKSLREIKANIDEYLSVIQIGVTGATIGMGIVFDEGLGQAVERVFIRLGWSGAIANLLSIALAMVFATFLTIVVGELVPKSIAIRHTEQVALIVARPMRRLHRVLYLPIMALNLSARLVMRVFGGAHRSKEVPTEEELRIILNESHGGGIIPFRRLLLFENLFDFGHATVGNAMRRRAQAKTLAADGTRQTMVEAVAEHGFSRYPLVASNAQYDESPLGIVHAKEVLSVLPENTPLSAVRRPYPTFHPETPLEKALTVFQRTHNHLAIVVDESGKWVGLLAFEDVIEELIGAIEDEFNHKRDVHFDELLSPARIVLDLAANSLVDAISLVTRIVPLTGLPDTTSTADVTRRLLNRERSLSSYVGRGIAIPHARINGLTAPIAIFVRAKPGIPIANRTETARFIFILLVPSGTPRIHLQLLSRIAHIADSNALLELLEQATTAEAIIEAIEASDRSSARP